MEPDAAPSNWVTIQYYYHPTEAHIAAGRVESEGIPVFLLGINHATANWLLSTALGGIQLQVPGEFAEEASQILAETVVPDVAEPTETHVCPVCGSTNTSTITESWRIAFLAVHLLSLPLPWKKDRRSCVDCHSEWSTKTDP